jgi:hypothetical protein
VNLNKCGGGATLYLVYRQDMPVQAVQLSAGGVPGFTFIDRNLRPRTTRTRLLCR